MYCGLYSSHPLCIEYNTPPPPLPPLNPPIVLNGDYLQQVYNEQCCGVEPDKCNIEFDKYLVLPSPPSPPPSPPVSVVVQLDISSASDYPEPGISGEFLQLVQSSTLFYIEWRWNI